MRNGSINQSSVIITIAKHDNIFQINTVEPIYFVMGIFYAFPEEASIE